MRILCWLLRPIVLRIMREAITQEVSIQLSNVTIDTSGRVAHKKITELLNILGCDVPAVIRSGGLSA